MDPSDFTPSFDGHMGDELFDIGWAEGVLQDGRPYRMECWGLAGSTGVTVFLPSEGIEAYDAVQVHALLESSRVITTLEPQEVSLHSFVDPSGTPCLSLSNVVANDKHFVEAHPLLTSYAGGGIIIGRLDTQELLDAPDAIEMTTPRRPSAMAEARRAAKALAKAQPMKTRPKRRKFEKGDSRAY